MSAANEQRGAPPSGTWKEREALIGRFEAAWLAGQRPSIDAYLPANAEDRRAVLVELAHADLECRLRAGEPARVEAYLRRYPELAEEPQVALELIEAEYRLRLRAEPGLAAEHYLQRFPQWRGELGARLPQPTVVHAPPVASTPSPGAAGTTEQPRTVGPRGGAAGSLGRYQLLAEVGRGGMAEVWRARDRDLGRSLAVKVLQQGLRGRPELVQRFREEAQVTGQLQHPGIPPVHEVGTLPDGRPFFAMKLVKGRTLDELLKERQGPHADLPRLLGIFEAVCQAVGYAHSKGVLHRDLKPANIMVGAFGEVQLMDWGLAKVRARPDGGAAATEASGVATVRSLTPGLSSQAGAVLGTPAYMAPEQARGEVEQLDERADVFGLGAILCVVLTGRPPYAGSSVQEVCARAAAGDVADALARLDGCGADAELVALAKACLAPARQERPADAGAVAQRVAGYQAGVQERLRQAELERARAEVQAAEERRRAEVQAAEQRKRRRLRRALGGLVLGVLLGLGGGLLYLHEQRTQRALRAQRANQAIAGALQQAPGLLERARWKETQALLEQARAQLAEADDPELAPRLERLEQELALARELDRIRQDKATLVEGKYDPRRAAPAYRQAFARHGLDVLAGEPAAVASAIGALGVCQQAVAALDDWAFEERGAVRRRLLEVARRADPGGGQERLRDPAVWQDRARLRRLAVGAKKGQRLSPALAVVLGLLLEEAGADGVAVMKRVQADSPADFWLCLTLAGALQKKGRQRREEALGYSRAALALRPDSAVAHNNLGVALHAKGEVREGIACFHRAIAADPKYAKAHTNLGLALYVGGQVEQAIACYRRAIALDPKYAGAHNNLGLALKAKGEVEQAIECYRKAIAADPRLAAVHNNLGSALYARGKVEQAIASYRQAIAADPELAPAHYNLGNALRDTGKVEEAIACYRSAIAADPKHALGHYNLGSALYARGKVEQAIPCFRSAIALAPKYAPAHINLGNALKAKGQVEEAIACYRQAITLAPKYAGAHNNLGLALKAKGEVEQAIECYRQAIAADPRFAPAHYHLGNALKAKGELVEAIACYRQAIAADPKDAPAHSNLG
jgi:tetratricopeptide (TPR) repeat protein